MSKKAMYTTKQWLKQYNVKTSKDGKRALLFKAVSANLMSRKSQDYSSSYFKNSSKKYMTKPYTVGTTVTAPDWKPTASCGHGLHFSPTQAAARSYHYGPATVLAVSVPIDKIVVLDFYKWSTPKCKAPTCKVLAVVSEAGFTRNLNNKTKTGDTLMPRRGNHQVKVVAHDANTITILTKNGRKSCMRRTSIAKSYTNTTINSLSKVIEKF